MLTVSRSWSVSRSSIAVRVRVTPGAVSPAPGPVKLTLGLAPPRPAQATPVGSGAGQASVKSTAGAPPANPSGTVSDSPFAKPRFSVREMLAVSLASPSMALASGVARVTRLASLSVMRTSAALAVPGS